MCGIFGFVIGTGEHSEEKEVKELVKCLFEQSYSRGKEASGLAIRSNNRISLFREAMSAVELIKYKNFQAWLDDELKLLTDSNGKISGPLTIMGHARLMTNGMQGINENNQPVYTDDTVVIHNGIIVNDAELTKKHKDITRKADVDSELLPLLIDKYTSEGSSTTEALSKIFDEAQGQISTLIIRADTPGVLVGTNFGSLYTFNSETNKFFLCMSEGNFLEVARKKSRLLERVFSDHSVNRLTPRQGFLVDEAGTATALDFKSLKKRPGKPNISRPQISQQIQLFDFQESSRERRENLTRCTKCILPETMPGINFDDDGVCNYCRRHTPYKAKGLDALQTALEPHRRTDGKPELIMGFSGGRDSSYGVHYVREQLGINVVTYTYDWALVTDVARRNISRISSKLGLEHVLISADIKKKRAYIRKNINAWLSSPQLGMVPLFMAGDKLYFYYYNQVKKNLGLDIAISCGNHFEKTDFKSGFCGVYNDNKRNDGKSWRPYDVSIAKKLKYLNFFAWHMGTNPGYWNSSLLDNAKGFYASYIMKHNFLWLFDYIPWEEATIDNVLAEEYNWETASDTKSTWRVGDGTASFYNYIYYTVAGFSEHDTFRSNQIRDGVITREKALALATRDNNPRFESILEYSHLIGFDFDHALATINQMPKLY